MSFELMKELDLFRGALGQKIVVTYGTQGDHIDGSFHYLGLAVDIIVPSHTPTNLLDLYLLASKFRFNGIGLYPDWMLGGLLTGGLHLDCRPGAVRATWLGVLDKRDRREYQPLTQRNLELCGLI